MATTERVRDDVDPRQEAIVHLGKKRWNAFARADCESGKKEGTMGTQLVAARVREPARQKVTRQRSATRISISAFGVVAALAGIEHGVGEILQGSVRPAGPAVESWPDVPAFEILQGEPALTLIPNMLVTGILAVAASVAVAIWAVGFAHRRHGGLVLILLSMLLLLVGGGFGPPLVGMVTGVGVTRLSRATRRPSGIGRAMGRVWPGVLVAALFGWMALMPGTVLLAGVAGIESAALVASLTVFSFAGLVAALFAARARDRQRALLFRASRREEAWMR